MKMWHFGDPTPSPKLDCFGPTKMGRISFSLLATTLEIILYVKLHNALGLNLLGVLDHFDLGMRVKKVMLKALKYPRACRDSSTISQTSYFIRSQK